MRYYPVGLNIAGKNVLVVGAGCVAERKIKTLRMFGANLFVVAPKATSYITRLSKKGHIRFFKRRYLASDIRRARLVIAATSDEKTNEKVSEDAKKRNIPVNVVDRTAICEFISPAIIRRGGLVVTVSTDAKDPPLAKSFKEFLEERIDEFYRDRNKP